MAFIPPHKKREYNDRYRKKQRDRARAQGKERKLPFVLRLPEGWIVQVQRMTAEAIAMGNGPWKTPQETARAIFAAGFEAMRDRSESVEDFLPQLRLQQQITDMDRARRTAESMYAMAKQNIHALLDIGERETAAQYYHTAMQQARELPPTVWSKWLISQLAKSFPKLASKEERGLIGGVKLGKHAMKKAGRER